MLVPAFPACGGMLVGGGVKTVQNGRFKNRFVFRGIHAGSMRSFMR